MKKVLKTLMVATGIVENSSSICYSKEIPPKFSDFSGVATSGL